MLEAEEDWGFVLLVSCGGGVVWRLVLIGGVGVWVGLDGSV